MAKDKITQADFALQSSTKIMDFYDDFFGVSYPLDKQDLIAIPEFGAGKMLFGFFDILNVLSDFYLVYTVLYFW